MKFRCERCLAPAAMAQSPAQESLPSILRSPVLSHTADLFSEVEEILDRMKNLAPLSRQEVCDHYGIALEHFPRFAQANLERELEMTRGPTCYAIAPRVNCAAIRNSRPV